MCEACDRTEAEEFAIESTTPRVNLELLEEVRDQIEAGILAEMVKNPQMSLPDTRDMTHVDGWNQNNWRTLDLREPTAEERTAAPEKFSDENMYVTCDAAYCVAGWAVQCEATRQLKLPLEQRTLWWHVQEGEPLHRYDGHDRLYVRRADGVVHRVPVEDTAVELLGLTEVEANWLFEGHNSLITVRGMIATLIAEEKIRRARTAAVSAAQAVEDPV